MRHPPAAAAVLFILISLALSGCGPKPKPYGVERRLALPAARQQVWAVAPAVNFSGEPGVDPLLQADLLFAELGAVRGVRAVPVNQTAKAMAGLGLGGIGSADDAEDVCQALGADALVVPTVTLYDPYDPPTMGASLQVYPATGTALSAAVLPDARATLRLTRAAREAAEDLRLPRGEVAASQFVQAAGVFDAGHGSTRRAAAAYARGRTDPAGPLAGRPGAGGVRGDGPLRRLRLPRPARRRPGPGGASFPRAGGSSRALNSPTRAGRGRHDPNGDFLMDDLFNDDLETTIGPAQDGGRDPLCPPREPRRLSLDKGGHRFEVRYETGCESQVLARLAEMVADGELPFDWFDAAVMGHQLGGHLAKELADLLPKKAA